MYGIEGYQPVAATSVDEVLAAHGDRLRALAGRRLHSATGLCFVGDGDWCSTFPAFFDFDGARLEVVTDGFDVLYLSWDTIDPGTPIDDPDQDDPDMAVAWGDPREPALDAVLGAVVREVNVLETELQIDSPDGRRLRRLMLAGLELVFDDGRALQLWNLVSELRITARPPDSANWQRHPVAAQR